MLQSQKIIVVMFVLALSLTNFTHASAQRDVDCTRISQDQTIASLFFCIEQLQRQVNTLNSRLQENDQSQSAGTSQQFYFELTESEFNISGPQNQVFQVMQILQKVEDDVTRSFTDMSRAQRNPPLSIQEQARQNRLIDEIPTISDNLERNYPQVTGKTEALNTMVGVFFHALTQGQ